MPGCDGGVLTGRTLSVVVAADDDVPAVGGGGTLKMELRSDSLTAALGATIGARAVTVSKTGYFGITASTGGSSESSHVVAAVRVRSCL